MGCAPSRDAAGPPLARPVRVAPSDEPLKVKANVQGVRTVENDSPSSAKKLSLSSKAHSGDVPCAVLSHEDDRQCYGGAPRPANEAARVQRLRQLGILDTPRDDPVFCGIVRTVQEICQVKIALVSLVDLDRQWHKASVGFEEVAEVDRSLSICAWTLLGEDRQPEVLVVPDACKDDRLRDHPFVRGPLHLRFYAGAPLITSDHVRLGTLCIMDTVPRPDFNKSHIMLLKNFAEIAVRDIERRELEARALRAHRPSRDDAMSVGEAASVTSNPLRSALRAAVQARHRRASSGSLHSNRELAGSSHSAKRTVTFGRSPAASSHGTARPPELARQKRAIDALREAVVMVDASRAGEEWPVLFGNREWIALAGEGAGAESDLWDALKLAPAVAPSDAGKPPAERFSAAVASGTTFHALGAVHGTVVQCRFKPAQEFMDLNALLSAEPRGVPDAAPAASEPRARAKKSSSFGRAKKQSSFGRSNQVVAARRADLVGLYMVTIVREAQEDVLGTAFSEMGAAAGGGGHDAQSSDWALTGGGRTSGAGGMGNRSMAMSVPFTVSDTTAGGLGERIGSLGLGLTDMPGPSGAERDTLPLPPFLDVQIQAAEDGAPWASYYAGLWAGAPVAVVCYTCGAGASNGEYDRRMEVALSSRIAHPNVVHTFKVKKRRPQVGFSNRLVAGALESSVGLGLSPRVVSSMNADTEPSMEQRINESLRDPEAARRSLPNATYIPQKAASLRESPLGPRGRNSVVATTLTTDDENLPPREGVEIWALQERCQGGALWDSLQSLPSAAHAAAVLRGIARGASYLHARGLAHGRLTPGAIRMSLSPTGDELVPKIGDLPAANSPPSNVHEDEMPYLAPEVIAGELPTPASDAYSLGAIGRLLLAGRLDDVRGAPPLRRAASRIPRTLWEILDQCLEPHPAMRPVVEQLASAIDEADLSL
ncbi:unnamed protein product [Pedinophyceae sp. YPF-701]|nr:unnamed protein product [Pedinophyceae sp. YPF-701]